MVFYCQPGTPLHQEGITAAVEQGDQQGIQAALSDQLMDEICLIGPLGRCQERLQALRELGLTYPILAPQPVQDDHVTAAQRVITEFAPHYRIKEEGRGCNLKTHGRFLSGIIGVL